MKGAFGSPATKAERRGSKLRQINTGRRCSCAHVLLHGVKHKSCAMCASLLPLDKFSTSGHHSDGLSSYCRPCDAKRQRDHAAKKRAAA